MDSRELERGLIAFAKNAIDDVKETFFGAQIAVECPRCEQLVDRKHLDTPCGEHPPLEEEDPYQQQVNVRFDRSATPEAKPKPEPKKWRSKEEKDRIANESIDRFNQGDGVPTKRHDGGYQRQIESRREIDDFSRRMSNALDSISYESPSSSTDSIASRKDEVPTYSTGDR